MTKNKRDKPALAITMGDAGGIGPEIIVKVLMKREVYDFCKPLVVGDSKVFQRAIRIIGANKLRVNPVHTVEKACFKHGFMDVLDLENLNPEQLVYGEPSSVAGKAAVECILKAIELIGRGEADALVTAPISKESIQMAGYMYPGHTELLANLTGAKRYAMMLIAGKLRVTHVTTHVALREIFKFIRRDIILDKIELTNEFLKGNLGIRDPRIAVAGINPHAGEKGLFGDEEIKEIKPAVEEAYARGINCSGPWPPDTVFLRTLEGEFDATVAMYHDQGHIAVKMIGLREGINVTIGLPLIRTSPDHGTAWDKAGKGTADPSAMFNAVKMAALIALNKGKVVT